MSSIQESGIATAELAIIIDKLSGEEDGYDWSGVHVYINGKEMNFYSLSVELGSGNGPVVKINEVKNNEDYKV